MKIETQPRDDHQVIITAEIEPDVLENSKKKAARKIAQETKIPGFRPGKAPYDIVRRVYGDEAILKEAVNLVIDEVYPKVLEQSAVEPYGPGSLEEIQSMEPLVMRFRVPLKPVVELSNYKELRKEFEPKPVTDEDVAKFIDQVRTNSSTAVPVERPAEEGDVLTLKITATRVNPKEDEKPELITDQPYQVMIRPENELAPNEWPFPGFCRELIGASAGEDKEFHHTFAEDSNFTNLRNQDADFRVTVQSVKKLELPELNEEFIQTLGKFDSIEDFQKKIRESLEMQAKDEYEQEYFTDLFDQIIDASAIKYPPQALEEEIEHSVDHLRSDLAQQNLDLETYLKIRKLEQKDFIESEIKPVATKRLSRTLVLEELLKSENIELDNAMFESAFSEAMNEILQNRNYEKMLKKMSKEQLSNAVAMDAISRALNRQVMDRLKLIATGQFVDEPAAETTEAVEEAPAEDAPSATE